MQLIGCYLYATAFLLCICQYSQATEDDRILACYLAELPSTNPNFSISEIDPFLCTHIIYGYTFVNQSGILDSVYLDPHLTSLFAKVAALKETNPKLKVLVNVFLDTNYPEVADRKRVVSSAIQFLREHKFDGLAVTPWCSLRNNLNQTTYIINLLKDVKEEFDKFGFYLSFSLKCPEHEKDSAVLSQISNEVHIVLIHCYYSKLWVDNEYLVLQSNSTLNIENCVKKNLGPVPNNKLVFTISLTGVSFKEETGDILDEIDFSFDYYKVCNLMEKEGWTKTWDETREYSVAVNGKKKIFYENERSLALKAQIAVVHNLKGIAVQFIENDDFKGVCSESDNIRFPLINKIKKQKTVEPRKRTGNVTIVIEEYG